MKKNIPNISEESFNILYTKFGYSALGYYYAIIEELKNNNLTYKLSKLKALARKLKIKYFILKSFIDECTTIYDKNGVSLFSQNNQLFWSNHLLENSIDIVSIINRKRRGRKKISIKKSIKITNAPYVNLTEEQIAKLNYKYGTLFIKKAIEILNKWLKENTKESKKYINKNNYGHFRSDSWLIYQTNMYFAGLTEKNSFN